MTIVSSDAPLYATGKPPVKSSTAVTLSFGFVHIPCSLYSTIEEPATPIRRHTYTKAGNAAGKRDYDKETGENVEADQIIKKAEATDGTLVEVTDDEIIEAYERSGVTSGEILTFVPLSALTDGTYIAEGFHQLRPAKIKKKGTKSTMVPSPAANKAFATLMAGMESRGVFALIKLVQKVTSVPRYAAVLPDGRLLVLCFASQIRQPRPMPTELPSEAEVQMVGALIDTIGIETPVLLSEEGEGLRAYVDAKAAGSLEKASDDVEAEPEPESDLMAMLAASLGVAPAAAAPLPPEPAPASLPTPDRGVPAGVPVGMGAIYKMRKAS